MAVTAEQALNQCLVWYGMGTGGLPTKQDAINDLVDFFTPRFEKAFSEDPLTWSDADQRHVLIRLFILRCSEAIGRCAAHEATKIGRISISVAEITLARATVIHTNKDFGPFCS